jgi:hypothetical protein
MEKHVEQNSKIFNLFQLAGSNYICMHDSDGCNGLDSAQYSNTPLLQFFEETREHIIGR